MIQKIDLFFWRIAGIKTFIPALLIYLFLGAVVMPYGAQTMQQVSGKKVEILDLQFTYTPEKAKAIIAPYGDAGRAYAAKFEMVADTLYPVSYTFLFLVIMGWVFKSLSVYGVRIRYIHLLPFLVMLADYSENSCIITMLNTFPNFSDGLAMVSSLFTSLKWSLLALETFIIGVALWLLTFYRITRRRATVKP